MNFNTAWTPFALDAEVEEFGTFRIAKEHNALRDEVTKLQSDIDRFWEILAHGWDIEDREYFERESRTNGFDSPLAQALHHTWKREPKVLALQAVIADLQKVIAEAIEKLEA